MKVGIIGVGAVGAATAMAVAMRARAREMVLIDRDQARAKAVATDMHYGEPLSALLEIRDGDYADLADAGVVVITAGINEKAGGATDRKDPAGRLRLLDANVKVYEDIVPKVVKVAPTAPILVVTDPPEPLIDVARHLAGHDRVLGTSTYLDSLRFRVHLAGRFHVSPSCVEANVVGEHGTSSVFLWSSARIGGRAGHRGAGQARHRLRQISPGGRAGGALRQYHDHRGHRRQPIWRRHGGRAGRRGDPARRARGLPRRLPQPSATTSRSRCPAWWDARG